MAGEAAIEHFVEGPATPERMPQGDDPVRGRTWTFLDEAGDVDAVAWGGASNCARPQRLTRLGFFLMA